MNIWALGDVDGRWRRSMAMGDNEVEVEVEDEEREARSDGTRVSWGQWVAGICQTQSYKLNTRVRSRGRMYE